MADWVEVWWWARIKSQGMRHIQGRGWIKSRDSTTNGRLCSRILESVRGASNGGFFTFEIVTNFLYKSAKYTNRPFNYDCPFIEDEYIQLRRLNLLFFTVGWWTLHITAGIKRGPILGLALGFGAFSARLKIGDVTPY